MTLRQPDPSRTPHVAGALWLCISLIAIVLDQALKQYFSATLDLGTRYAVTDFFNLVHARNYGAAFSFLADAGGWQRYFFLVLAGVVALVLTVLLIRGVASRLEAFAYAAIIGGAVGNAIDRVRLGYVVDFLDFHLGGWHWPAFNVADICITTGAAALIACSFLASPQTASPPREEVARKP